MVLSHKARQNSNVFSMFDKKQWMEFHDTFKIMDTNGDGFLDFNDLNVTFQRLGKPAESEEIIEMLGDKDQPVNFTVFVTWMAEKLDGTDPENTILKAFSAFDDNKDGKINADFLRECMTTMGDRFTEEEANIMFKGPVVDKEGNFEYKDFVRILKHGE